MGLAATALDRTAPGTRGGGEAFVGNPPTQSRETGGSSGGGRLQQDVHSQDGKTEASLRAAERKLLAGVGREKRREDCR